MVKPQLRALACNVAILCNFISISPFVLLRNLCTSTNSNNVKNAPNQGQRLVNWLSKLMMWYATYFAVKPKLFDQSLALKGRLLQPYNRMYILIPADAGLQQTAFTDDNLPAKLSDGDRSSVTQAAWYLSERSAQRVKEGQSIAHTVGVNDSVILYFREYSGVLLQRPFEKLLDLHVSGASDGGAFITFAVDDNVFLDALGLMTQTTGKDILAVDYRRAPESKFPSQLCEAYRSFAYLRTQGFRKIVLAGDSAGGNIALTLYHYLYDHFPMELESITGMVLFSPWLDLGFVCSERAQVQAKHDHLPSYFTREGCRSYLPNTESQASNPWFSPYSWIKERTDLLQHLPPTYILVGTNDSLQVENADFAAAVHRQAKGKENGLVLDIDDGSVHDFIICPWFKNRTVKALVRVKQWMNQLTGEE